MGVTALGAAGIAAGVSALLGAGSGIMSSRLNFRQTRNLMSYQNQLNRQNWTMQNEYNTPVNQRSRLIDAGINPILAGSDAQNTAEGISPVGLGTAQPTDLGSALPSAMDAFNAQANLSNTEAETEYKTALAANTEELTNNIVTFRGYEIQLKEDEHRLNEKEAEYKSSLITKANQEADNLEQQFKQATIMMPLEQRRALLDNAILDISAKLKQGELDHQGAVFMLYDLKERAGIKLLNKQVEESQSRIDLNNTQGTLNKSLALQSDAQTASIWQHYDVNSGEDATSPLAKASDAELQALLEQVDRMKLANLKTDSDGKFTIDDLINYQRMVAVYLSSAISGVASVGAKAVLK